jgi:hypothetical protein
MKNSGSPQIYNTVGILFYLNPVLTFTFYIPDINIMLCTVNKIVIFLSDILVCTVVSSARLNYIYEHFKFYVL